MALLTEHELELLLSDMTESQIRFCEEYIIDHNGARSARCAGYSVNNAKISASRLLTYENVKKLISHLKSQRSIEVKLSGEMVIKELMKIAFQNVNDLVDYEDGEVRIRSFDELGDATRTIKKIKTSQNPNQGRIVEIEAYDKLKALELLGKHTAIFTDNINLTNNGKDLPETKVVNNIVINHRAKGEEIARDQKED